MANIVSGDAFVAYDSDPNNLTVVWTKPTVGTSSKYMDPVIKYHYPISYGSTFTDSIKVLAYDEMPPNPGYVGTYPTLGRTTYTCNGYGTLYLPNGINIPNALKINILTSAKIVDATSNDSLGYEYSESEEYFSSISKFPILAYTKSEKKWMFSWQTAQNYSYGKYIQLNADAITSLNQIYQVPFDVSLFPNPSNKFNLIIKSSKYIEKPVFVVQNSLGQEISTLIEEFSADYYTLNAENYYPGVYFLTIKIGKNQITKKILVK